MPFHPVVVRGFSKYTRMATSRSLAQLLGLGGQPARRTRSRPWSRARCTGPTTTSRRSSAPSSTADTWSRPADHDLLLLGRQRQLGQQPVRRGQRRDPGDPLVADPLEALGLAHVHVPEPVRRPSAGHLARHLGHALHAGQVVGEAVGVQLLGAVADRVVGVGVDLHDQAVGARRGGGHGHRLDQVAAAGGVAGVDDHRQVRQLLEHRHRHQVEREPVGGLERADAALAQDHVAVALLEHVLGGHQQLLERGAQAALDQHGHARRGRSRSAACSSACCARPAGSCPRPRRPRPGRARP